MADSEHICKTEQNLLRAWVQGCESRGAEAPPLKRSALGDGNGGGEW